jgi:hypothetical protein
MKKGLLFIILLCALSVNAQTVTQTVIRRITNTSGTIPSSDTITGVVKIDTAYSATYKYLRYIGTTNIANTFPSGAIGAYGWMYVYVPSDSCLAKVLSVAAVGDATLDTFRIQVDRIMPFTGSKALKSIKAKDFSFTLVNDGSNTGYTNNVALKAGEFLNMPNSAIAGTGSQSTWQEPVIINATGTDFYILERKGQ